MAQYDLELGPEIVLSAVSCPERTRSSQMRSLISHVNRRPGKAKQNRTDFAATRCSKSSTADTASERLNMLPEYI
jgi:hypothetical protein